MWCIVLQLISKVCSFFHDNPEPLERLQNKHWTPLLEWARKAFDIKIDVSNSIMSVRQPAETQAKLEKAIESFDQWEMAGQDKLFLDIDFIN